MLFVDSRPVHRLSVCYTPAFDCFDLKLTEILMQLSGVAAMTGIEHNLIWVDMEMTGLIPEIHHVIELAIIVTDSNLEILAEAPVMTIYQPEAHLSVMDEWNTRIHTQSGLVDRVRKSSLSEKEASAKALMFLADWIGPNQSPMCGNSICQDRRFMAKHLPDLESYFHYRHVDVSSVKELISRWMNDAQTYEKKGSHRAKDDIKESINELKLYKQMLFD